MYWAVISILYAQNVVFLIVYFLLMVKLEKVSTNFIKVRYLIHFFINFFDEHFLKGIIF